MLIKKALIGVLAGVFIILFGIHAVEYFQIPEKKSESEIEKVISYWKSEIENSGSEAAYGHFKEQYKDAPSSAHALLHAFSSLLYEKEGMKGFAVCDDTFGNGCYHGLVARAVLDQGVAILPQLGLACTEVNNPNSCVHGIGHGLMEYSGTGHLMDALAACERLRDVEIFDPIGSCFEGVFMDYNAPIGTARVLNETNVFSPCSEEALRLESKASCYQGLPHWWFQQEEMKADTVAHWCAGVPDPYKVDCYSGMGVDLPGNLDYNEQAIIDVCSSVPDEEGRMPCMATSAETLVSLGLSACLFEEKFAFDGGGSCMQTASEKDHI